MLGLFYNPVKSETIEKTCQGASDKRFVLGMECLIVTDDIWLFQYLIYRLMSNYEKS